MQTFSYFSFSSTLESSLLSKTLRFVLADPFFEGFIKTMEIGEQLVQSDKSPTRSSSSSWGEIGSYAMVKQLGEPTCTSIASL